jgi:hypothetical protein
MTLLDEWKRKDFRETCCTVHQNGGEEVEEVGGGEGEGRGEGETEGEGGGCQHGDLKLNKVNSQRDSIVTDLINTLPGNSSIKTFQRATVNAVSQ